MAKTDLIALSKARASMYRFLGGLYIMEVDENQLIRLKKMDFPQIDGDSNSDLDLKDGYSLMRKYLDNIEASDLEDLAADYAKVFLAAGDATGRAAFPYEAVYVNKKHQVGGSTQMQMHALYLERGLEPDPNVYRTMDDNIGLMLEYMANICDEITTAVEVGDKEQVTALVDEQKQFMKKHITNWIYSFTNDVIKFSERDFYKAVAKITNGFIKKETELLQEGGKVWDID